MAAFGTCDNRLIRNFHSIFLVLVFFADMPENTQFVPSKCKLGDISVHRQRYYVFSKATA
jgi:hypothetical protein